MLAAATVALASTRYSLLSLTHNMSCLLLIILKYLLLSLYFFYLTFRMQSKQSQNSIQHPKSLNVQAISNIGSFIYFKNINAFGETNKNVLPTMSC